ncbi:MAG TPA: diaminopimelate decarboxylase [Actinomycetota bacterium]|nr:diaminopimelate decarboxylase [Actinomycetota bacterium]
MPAGDRDQSLPDVFPETARINAGNELEVGGCSVPDLARRFGTPLYVFDEPSIRNRARAFREVLRQGYPGPSLVCYAAKAYCAPWLLAILAREGLGLDVVSGGELYAATTVGFPSERIFFHGNYKTPEELDLALEVGVGRVVIDNLEEVRTLGRLAAARGVRQAVLIRVTPGVAADTHAHLHTGGVDTKFGTPIDSGQAEEVVRAAMAEPALEVRGLHAHVGSQIRDPDPFLEAIDRVVGFGAALQERTSFRLAELSPGGGFAVRYAPQDPRVEALDLVREVAHGLARSLRRHGIASWPRVTIEPGRSLVGPAAIAVYEVGSVKSAPGGTTYVAVDGGMADNIRPTAYGATYTAVLANRVRGTRSVEVAIAGRYCESGDILIRNVALPEPRPGDLVAVPVAGAYQLSMASNYNMSRRPAVLLVRDGEAHLVRRRETYADLLLCEAVPEGLGATERAVGTGAAT